MLYAGYNTPDVYDGRGRYRDCFGVPGARSFLQPGPSQQAGYGAPAVFSAPSTAERGLVCANCQMSLPPTAVFCPRCGSNVIA